MEFQWATRETVNVTAIGPSAVLIERTAGPGAFVLDCNDQGDVLINGEVRSPDGYDEEWLDLADSVLMGPRPAYGRTITIRLDGSRTLARTEA
jgi:hypothetical protein